MKRRLQMMIVAVLALMACAAWAAPAQAEPLFEADSYPAAIDGTAVQASIFTMEGPYKWECKATTMTGELSGKSGSLTLTPTYGECRWNYPVLEPPVWRVVTMTMNGCDYLLHSLKRLKADEYSVSVDLQCPSGKQVVVHLTSTMFPTCQVTLPAQSNLTSTWLVDTTGKEGGLDDVVLNLAMGPMKFTQDVSGCPVKAGSHETFTIENRMTLTGTAGGKQIGFRIAGE